MIIGISLSVAIIAIYIYASWLQANQSLQRSYNKEDTSSVYKQVGFFKWCIFPLNQEGFAHAEPEDLGITSIEIHEKHYVW